MRIDEYMAHDAIGLADLVRTREVSAIELLDVALDLLHRINPHVNAVVVDTAGLAARDADALLAVAPFAGVPFLVADVHPVSGFAMAQGSRLQASFVADHDSELVRRCRDAGFLIVGKTNVAEFSLLPATEPALHGPTRNPWLPERTAGGSSGGSAAAVAARIVPAAHGHDAAGSIRVAASCCGVVGFTPTRGRIAAGPGYGAPSGGLAIDGIVTRSVRDCAALLDVMTATAGGDIVAAASAKTMYLRESAEKPATLRIAVLSRSPVGTPIDADCIAALDDAAALLAALGHEVDSSSLPLDPLTVDSFFAVYASSAAFARDEAVRRVGRLPGPGDLEPSTSALALAGDRITAAQYMAAWEQLHKLARELAAMFGRYDAILTPAIGQAPPAVPSTQGVPEDAVAVMDRMMAMSPFAALASMIGHPAMSVPLYWTREQMPIGVQFIGGFGREDVLIRLATRLEAARPWAARVPAIVTEALPAA